MAAPTPGGWADVMATGVDAEDAIAVGHEVNDDATVVFASDGNGRRLGLSQLVDAFFARRQQRTRRLRLQTRRPCATCTA